MAQRRVFAGLAAAGAAAVAAGLVGSMFLASPAHAAPMHHVSGTGTDGLWLHDTPSIAAGKLLVLPEGSDFLPDCWTSRLDQSVSGNPIWLHGTSSQGSQGYVTDVYVDTTWRTTQDLVDQGIPSCDTAQTPVSTPGATSSGGSDQGYSNFNRDAAVEWALANVYTKPSFGDGDCTWYASQVLWAGGLPKSDDWNGKTFDLSKIASRAHYPGPTKDAVQAQDFVDYLVNTKLATKTEIKWSDNTADGAEKGDIIAYDWNNGADGSIDHISVVTSVDETGYPHVSQHSPARPDRAWSWDPTNKVWIQHSKDYTGTRADGSTIEPKAYLIHITA